MKIIRGGKEEQYVYGNKRFYEMDIATGNIHDRVSGATINVENYVGGDIVVSFIGGLVKVDYTSSEGSAAKFYSDGFTDDNGTPMGYGGSGVPFGLRGKPFHMAVSGNKLEVQPNGMVMDGSKEAVPGLVKIQKVLGDGNGKLYYDCKLTYGINSDVVKDQIVGEVEMKTKYASWLASYYESQIQF